MKIGNRLGIGVMVCLLATAQMEAGAPASAASTQEVLSPSPGEISLRSGSLPSSPPATSLPSEQGPGVNPPKTLTSFFLIGIVLNLLLVILVGSWAYKRLRKPRRPNNP